MTGSTTGAPARDLDRLRQVRSRLWRAVLIPFAIAMAAATAQGFWPGEGPGRPTALLILFLVAILAPVPMALLARRVISEIEGLEGDRVRLSDLYGRARLDALQDVLTGLGNHRAFQEELVRQLELARRQGTSLAMLLIDVDDLKRVNDERGHVGGDELLAAVGQICAAVLRKPDRAFRVGGDEFVALLPGADLDRGLTVGRRILAAALGGGDPSAPIDGFSLSIGASAFPSPSPESHLLYQHADAALYWCKRHGRTAVIGFDPKRHAATASQQSVAELSAAVSRVVATRQFRPVYQPIFSLQTGRVVGYEGLVRPTDDAPFADPSSLFAAAEVAGRIVELDFASLDAVARDVGELDPDVYLSLNVSPRTLESAEFHAGELISVLRRHAVPLHQVVLELTEREEVQDLAHLRRNVEDCRRAGLRVAADDVGAGNAGLRLLSEIQFDILKVDLSLVHGGIVNDPTHAIIQALQDIAVRWQATIVAEGIETSEQLAMVRQVGIAAGQGYLLGRPAPSRSGTRVDLEALVAAGNSTDPRLLDQAVAESVAARRAAQAGASLEPKAPSPATAATQR